MGVIVSSITERKYVTILILLTAVMPLTRTFQGFRTFAVFVRHLRTQHSICKGQTIRVKPQPAIQSKHWLKVCRGYKYYYMFCTKWTFVIWLSNVCFNTIKVDGLEQDLSCHPERSFVRQLITGLREGFDARIQQLSVQSYISGKKSILWLHMQRSCQRQCNPFVNSASIRWAHAEVMECCFGTRNS